MQFIKIISLILAVLSPSLVLAQGYSTCEKYEYAELKSLTKKQLQEEFCNVRFRTNDIYKAIAYAPSGSRRAEIVISDRNDCWQAMEKIRRQLLFKSLNQTCPGLVEMSPLDAALKKAEDDLARSKEVFERLNAK